MRTKVLALLKATATGRENAVKAKAIKAYLGLGDSQLRDIVNSLRLEGNPICSCGSGYFYASNKVEVNESINQLQSRIMSILSAKQGLISSLDQFNSCGGGRKQWQLY